MRQVLVPWIHAEAITEHARVLDVILHVIGNHITLLLDYLEWYSLVELGFAVLFTIHNKFNSKVLSKPGSVELYGSFDCLTIVGSILARIAELNIQGMHCIPMLDHVVFPSNNVLGKRIIAGAQLGAACSLVI